MITSQAMDTTERRSQLHAIARAYVEIGLGKKNFDAIPYHENVTLRAPIMPGGSEAPVIGRDNLRAQWWAPLPGLLGAVDVMDSYVNDDLNAVTVEFFCEVVEPACVLRIIDRFKVNLDGEITDQENFFDPRDVTNPGWRGE